VKPLIPFVDRDIADVPKSIDLSLIKTDFLLSIIHHLWFRTSPSEKKPPLCPDGKRGGFEILRSIELYFNHTNKS